LLLKLLRLRLWRLAEDGLLLLRRLLSRRRELLLLRLGKCALPEGVLTKRRGLPESRWLPE